MLGFRTLICGDCGLEFGVPHGLYKLICENQRPFWCPNGHKLWIKKSDPLQKERREEEHVGPPYPGEQKIAEPMKETA